MESLKPDLSRAEFETAKDLLKTGAIPMRSIKALARDLKKPSKTEPSRIELLDQSYDRIRAALSLKTHIKDDAAIMYYVDPINEVYPCYKEKFDGFTILLQRHPELLETLIAEYHVPENAPIRAQLRLEQFLSELYSRFQFDPSKRLKSEPPPLSWDPAIPAYKQLDKAILRPDPTPTWDQFTSRLDFPDHFKAFVWSIFEPGNKGRQALYLYGAGFDGKSSAFNAIANVLGDRHTMSIDNEKLKNTQFFYGNVHGKRLVLYPDCKVTSVIRHEVIKSLLGNDKVQINRKNRDAFNSSVHVKLMIGSNRYPRIDSADKSERTRLMFLKVSEIKDNRGDHKFEFNLRAEIGPFLWQCEQAYLKLCPTHAEFDLPDEMQSNIREQCNSQDADAIEDFIENRLDFGPEKWVSKRDIELAFAEELLRANVKQIGFNNVDTLQVYLARRGAAQKRRQVGKQKITCYVGVTLLGKSQSETVQK